MKPKVYYIFALIFGLAGCAPDDLHENSQKDSWRLTEPVILTQKGSTDRVFHPNENSFSLEDSLSFAGNPTALATQVEWTIESRCNHAVSGVRTYTKKFTSHQLEFQFRDLLPADAIILSAQNPGALRCYFSITGKNSSGSSHRFETPWMTFIDADQSESPGLQLVNLNDGQLLPRESFVFDESMISLYGVRGLSDQAGEATLACETFTVSLRTQSLRDLDLKDLLSTGTVDPVIHPLPWHSKPLQLCRFIWKEDTTDQMHFSAAHPFRFAMEPAQITARLKQLANPQVRQFPARHPVFPKAKKAFQAYGADISLELEIHNPNPAPIRIGKLKVDHLSPTGKVHMQTKIGKKKLSGDSPATANFRADRSSPEINQEIEIPAETTLMVDLVFEYGFICFDMRSYVRSDSTVLGATWTIAQNLEVPVIYPNGVLRGEKLNPALHPTRFKFRVNCDTLNFVEYLKK